MNLEQMLALFLDSRKRGLFGARKNCREKTVRIYKDNLRLFFDQLSKEGKHRYEDLNRVSLGSFQDWMKHKVDSGEWAKATELQVLRTLRAFFNWVLKDDDCIAADLHKRDLKKYLPKIEKTKPRNVNIQITDLSAIANSFDLRKAVEYRDHVALCLLLDNGMRLGELCNVKLDHILWDEALMFIEGKTGPRAVPISKDIARKLKGWIRRRQEFHTAATSAYLFLSKRSPKMAVDAWGTHLARHRKRHNLPRLTAHMCRHLFCTNYLASGGDIGRLRNISGHSSLDQLQDYLQVSGIKTRVAKDELERVSLLKKL